jgi:hypothetical protein
LKNLALIAVPVVVILAAALFGYYLPGRRRRRMRQSPIALAPFAGQRTVIALPPRPERRVDAEVAKTGDPQTADPRPPAYAPPPSAAPQHQARATQEYALDPAVGDANDGARVFRLQVPGDRHARDEPRAHHSSLRLERPADGTLQFLPGRLEVVEGRNMGQEIRFVRTGGSDGTTVTFGRSEGPPYRHVQLHEQTVSRQHAKMHMDGKLWTLSNMSATNPVVVNGMAMANVDTPVVLRDGDRIEMGEVVFRFRSK